MFNAIVGITEPLAVLHIVPFLAPDEAARHEVQEPPPPAYYLLGLTLPEGHAIEDDFQCFHVHRSFFYDVINNVEVSQQLVAGDGVRRAAVAGLYTLGG